MNYRNILVVHEDSKPLDRLANTLNNVGHQVNVALCSADALLFLRNEHPDLIIASDDLTDPDVFGFFSSIKQEPFTLNGVRLMIVARKAQTKAKRKAQDLGVDDYVAEPFTLPALLNRINEILDEGGGAEDDRHSELAGSIAQSGLIDVLQLLEFSAKSGVLTITSDVRNGTMAFSEGQLVSARMGDTRGENAVYEMLSWDEGEFEFQAEDIPSGNGGIASISSLVLEWARVKDEKNKQASTEEILVPADDVKQEASPQKNEEVEEEEEQPYTPGNWASQLNSWLGYLRDEEDES